MRRSRAQYVEPLVRKGQNTEHTLKTAIFGGQNDCFNMFFMAFSLGKTK